ncbi:DUF998 domain-containing protein [Halosolutus gelatinilyticus]|uniref:DUF998 domain-containing protein n=1 Tax=Halosolutus gelatinilyticus TaxID=2931975 RepID=UPI002AAF143C|nr:DUF998 domain-containing protein [Halosolutus gelatinilyticus]
MPDTDWQGIATRCGLAAPVVALGSLLLATIVASPETFTWRGHALTEMERYGAETFWLFNGGLIVGGLLGLPFGWRLWRAGRHVVERAGVALVLVAVGGMIVVGVFFLDHAAVYLDTELHVAAALAFFGIAPFAQWV